MAFSDKVSKILYGGDYNPEQWTPDIWEQDMELLEQAGIDVVTLNVFNWASLQPSEETYDFAELDAAVKRVTEQGMAICMATSTGAHPAWMAKRYPEVLRTDFEGRRRKFGGRHNSCPNSPVFKQYAKRLAGKLAERYREQKNIVLWHVSNEYEGACYCENCEKAFRVWLKKRYGTIENLNRLWNTRFWGHTFYDWDEIVAPSMVSEHFEEARSMYQAITLDYKRFNSDSMLANYRAEAEAIRAQIPDACITTNFMGAYKPLDYKKWAASLDVVSWDNYPAEGADPAAIAMNHDLMRGLKHGQPFLLMEQTPSTCNWLNDNRLKRPGVMRLLSYQAVAHGADTVMFFQMRRSRAGCEKFHGAVIDHAGHGNTRVFKECQALGMELKALGKEVVGARVPAKAALIFDWDTWWALECSAGPSVRLKYLEELQNYYRALSKLHIPVDIIGMEDGFCGYELIAAPLLYMVKEMRMTRLLWAVIRENSGNSPESGWKRPTPCRKRSRIRSAMKGKSIRPDCCAILCTRRGRRCLPVTVRTFMQALPLSPGTSTETVWPITLEHGPEGTSISGYSRMCVRKRGCEQPPMIRWKRRPPYPKRESR